MLTEKMSLRFIDLDVWPTSDAIMALLEGQLSAAAAVKGQVTYLAAAAEAAAQRLQDRSGRLVYVGAGASGRIAVQDGVELGPTYGWPRERLIFALAGGEKALLLSVENAEDDAEGGAQAMRQAQLTRSDVVIGLAATGTTPYTVAAIHAARSMDALTIAISSNADTPLLSAAVHPIFLDTGAEIIAGSTRMKAGTAQKIVLNLLSTAVMLRLGRVYRGLMVDMRISNQKLRERAIRIVAEIASIERPAAEAALEQAGNNIKLAALIGLGADANEALVTLREAGDNLRFAVDRLHKKQV